MQCVLWAGAWCFNTATSGVYKTSLLGSLSSSTQISLSRRRNFGDVDLRRRIDKDSVLNQKNAAAEDLLGQPLFQISVGSVAHFKSFSESGRFSKPRVNENQTQHFEL